MSTSCTTSSPIACARSRRAIERPSSLEQWVEHKRKPPENRTLARPASGDLANECSLSDDIKP